MGVLISVTVVILVVTTAITREKVSFIFTSTIKVLAARAPEARTKAIVKAVKTTFQKDLIAPFLIRLPIYLRRLYFGIVIVASIRFINATT